MLSGRRPAGLFTNCEGWGQVGQIGMNPFAQVFGQQERSTFLPRFSPVSLKHYYVYRSSCMLTMFPELAQAPEPKSKFRSNFPGVFGLSDPGVLVWLIKETGHIFPDLDSHQAWEALVDPSSQAGQQCSGSGRSLIRAAHTPEAGKRETPAVLGTGEQQAREMGLCFSGRFVQNIVIQFAAPISAGVEISPPNPAKSTEHCMFSQGY